jgi:hypothetical protein
MVFVLSGMVGYLYWQQTRMLQHLQSLALALATHVEQTRREIVEQPESEDEEENQEETDDRVSVVKEQVEVVEGPPTATEVSQDDVDDLPNNTQAAILGECNQMLYECHGTLMVDDNDSVFYWVRDNKNIEEWKLPSMLARGE